MTLPITLYRVTADWAGGGFAYTLPFLSAEEARQWALGRCKDHPGAVVTAEERGPMTDISEQEWIAADLRFLATQKLRMEQRRQETMDLERSYVTRRGWNV